MSEAHCRGTRARDDVSSHLALQRKSDIELLLLFPEFQKRRGIYMW